MIEMKNVAQGDVTLFGIGKLPEGLRKKDAIIAHSESGHHHIVEGNAVVYTDGNGQQYVQVFGKAQLTHQKIAQYHRQIQLEKGVYKVVPEREYSPAAERKAMD